MLGRVFNGTSSYLTIPTLTSKTPVEGSWSIWGWIYADDVTTQRSVYSVRAASNRQLVCVSLGLLRWVLYDGISFYEANIPITKSNWHFFVASNVNTSLSLSLNNILSQTTGAGITINTSAGLLGANGVSADFWSGEIAMFGVTRLITNLEGQKIYELTKERFR